MEVIVPNPENTGTGRRAPNLPEGSSGYVTPGGQTLYPGDTGGGGFPWDTTSGLGSLIQKIAGTSSGPGSAFGFNDLGSLGSIINDIVSQLGPPSQDGKADLTKLLGSMFQMPIMNQYSGNFGSRQDDVAQMIADYAAQLHSIGDPTHGRVPGTSTKSPNIPTPADFAAHARAVGARLMKQWTDYELQGHDPNRGNPISGGPHPQWWSNDFLDNLLEAGKKVGIIAGCTLGGAIVGAGVAEVTGVGELATVITILGALGGVVIAFSPKKMPGPDDGGGGPRSRTYFPSDDGGSGPRSYAAMPGPDDGSGGPRWFPNPDDAGGGPRGAGV